MNSKWSCIVITCPTSASVISTEKEIKFLKKKGRVAKSLCVLTVEDPAKNMGSGAATLNALLVVTEYLSSKQNYMVISSDALLNSHILILHNGRENLYSCSEKAFIPLPLEYTPKCAVDKLYASGMINNLEAALQLIDELSVGSPPGVWVCSTDMMILRGSKKLLNWERNEDVVMFCVPSDIDYATGHGVVSIDKEGYIADINYCASMDLIKNLAQGDEKVPLVSGIVFLTTNVAESLLALEAQAPLDSCTYLGLDSGNKPMQVSLFFDLLVAMSSNMDKENFVSGNCGKTYNIKLGISEESSNEIRLARSLIWKELSKYRMSAEILIDCQHLYWSSLHCPKYHMSNLFKIATSQVVHSLCQVANTLSSPPEYLIMNSCIQAESSCISPGAIISDSFIEACVLNVGENAFLSGITFLENHSALNIPSNTAVINVLTKENIGNNITVILGIHENPFIPVNLSTSTFCCKSWLQLTERLKTNEMEIWNADLTFQERTIANAKLFVPNLSLEDVIHLFCAHSPDLKQEFLLKRWRESKRFSINEILESMDYAKVLNLRRHVYAEISCRIIKKVLINNEDLYLLPYFYAACCEGWSQSIMNTLDSILISDQSSVIKTRTLSNMADLLSAMAGTTGGLRSGPGNNRLWEKAFELLLVGHTIAGIKALSRERSKWVDRPDHLIRAARHYERAAQILIQNSVKTVKKFITLSPSTMPDMGTVITVECPARIDLQGGWSDTPPICYELGGSVVNIAVLIDGKKPIGARAYRIKEPHIRLKIGIGELCHEVLITDVKDVLNYDQPNAKGALLKAAIICTEIIDITSTISLADQLLSKFGGGFEIQSWSLLPQGCGMGTSSILAGAIIAALWSVSGKHFDKPAVIHAVLYVEQLLTTGGGWQDQVSGIIGGINRGYSDPSLPLNVKVEPLILPEGVIEQLNARFLLIYTGKVRLAKNLLQNVIRNWYAREKTIVKCFKDLFSNALKMKNALQNSDFSEIGILMGTYWEQKKLLAPGCEPASVKEIMRILEPLCYGQLLVGAGGGGYMCVLTKEPNDMKNLKSALKMHKEHEKLSIHTVDVDLSGLEIS